MNIAFLCRGTNKVHLFKIENMEGFPTSNSYESTSIKILILYPIYFLFYHLLSRFLQEEYLVVKEAIWCF